MIEDQRDPLIGDLAFYKSVLDALEAHIAVLDTHGTILAVNTSWQRFGETNGLGDSRFAVGVNYFDVCRAAVDPFARAAASGIREVLQGRQSSFFLEYPCHSPDEERWFALRATPLLKLPGLAVVAHENITQRVIADRASTRSSTAETLDLVVERFPRCRDQIERLAAENPVFLEICEDYQELAASIIDARLSNRDSRLVGDSMELVDSLAREIEAFLGER